MKRILSLFLILSIIFTLSSCSSKTENNIFELKKIQSPVNIHTETQQSYIDAKEYSKVSLYASNSDDTIPKSLMLSWKYNGDNKPESYTVYVSETKDFKNSITQFSKRTNVPIYNLKLGTEYYWKVTAQFKDETEESDVLKFKTADGKVRFIFCDGVTNMRDLGGYTTEEGKKIKQGMIYRCARLNENESSTKLITDYGLSQLNELGIKSEIDLRGSKEAGITRSVVFDAKYINIPIIGSYTDGTYYQSNKSTLVDIFKFLGDENNYPAIIHCKVGTDRTGFVSYTLGALLGIKKDDLIKDYLFSNFSKGFSPTSRTYDFIKDDYVAGYDSEEGETLSEKVENHLLNIGVSKNDIDTFKKMMTE